MDVALVLLSGGQDSATCLAWAKKQFDSVYTLTIDYGQRHRAEIDCAKKLSILAKVKSHSVLLFPTLAQIGDSALLSNGDVSAVHHSSTSLPASFVPGRNYLFLGLAAARAFSFGIRHLVIGACQTDFAGYPDCRDHSIKAVEIALFLCLGDEIIIHTPLMWKTKAETVLMMQELGCLAWYRHTQTCYEGMRPPCGRCPACELRAKGFREARIGDPLIVENW